MKKYLFAGIIIAIIIGCASTKSDIVTKKDNPNTKYNDTVRIANDALEYEIIIIDAGFNGWLASNARPRKFYSQQYFEARNIVWVQEWNMRVLQPDKYSANLFEMQIDYRPNIDYGYEVNYLLFNYLNYFQIRNNIRLGSFGARI